jgi:hypothetical protein
MNKDPAAWKVMEKYNKQDVLLLEKVYDRLLPWIKSHPNHNLFSGHGCPNCGSGRLQKRGFTYTTTGTFQRFQCTDCGSWSKSSKAIKEHANVTAA